MRVLIDFGRNPQRYRYTDSMNAALVAGLVAAGLRSDELVGERALPWTFGTAGRAGPDGKRIIASVTLSSPSERFAQALTRLDPGEFRVASSNGDTICLADAVLRHCPSVPAGGVDELMVAFASPFLVPMPKQGREKTHFYDDLSGVDLNAALVAGVSRRAGRSLDLTISTDRLSMATDLRKQLVHVRRLPNGKPLFHPAFSVPMTLRGRPEDVRFAFLAGVGAKTHAGFGCPILMR
ncbi:MAG: hypothetical protein JSR42_21070 [Proteobacteria bacterium]|nr:hypothetical protein [Pseudomonadota bacterium]